MIWLKNFLRLRLNSVVKWYLVALVVQSEQNRQPMRNALFHVQHDMRDITHVVFLDLSKIFTLISVVAAVVAPGCGSSKSDMPSRWSSINKIFRVGWILLTATYENLVRNSAQYWSHQPVKLSIYHTTQWYTVNSKHLTTADNSFSYLYCGS